MDHVDQNLFFLTNGAFSRRKKSILSNWFKEIGSEIADKGPSWAKENNRVIGAVDIEESVKAVAQGVA